MYTCIETGSKNHELTSLLHPPRISNKTTSVAAMTVAPEVHQFARNIYLQYPQ